MFNMSASQGQRFAQFAREMTERIRSLGPSPVNKNVKRES
jgi:coenzyme F420-reducing hydrogenase delta subunit